MSNLQTVQAIYQAFGRGDVAAILDRLSPTVEWEYPEGSPSVPWLRRRTGREAVAGFFRDLGDVRLEKFVPKEFLEGPAVVVVLIDVELVVKATGRRVVEDDEIHVWRFDARGQVARFRHGIDTHRHHLALHGGAA